MAKIPKFSDLTASVPGMIEKFKSLFDAVTGPGSSSITQEALAKETDPFKIKLIEVELLISQLNDIQVIQARSINSLRTTYAELQKMIREELGKSNDQSFVDEKPISSETISENPVVPPVETPTENDKNK